MTSAHRDAYHSRSILYDKRIVLDHFQNESTYECDYRYYLPKKRWMHKWSQDTSEVPVKTSAPYFPISYDSLVKWRAKYKPPFNLLWEPKPIIGTNPYEKQVLKHINIKIDESEDAEKLSQQPTTISSPAVRISKLENREDRDIIIKSMYKTDWAKAAEEAVQATFKDWNSTIPSTFSTVDPNISLTYKADIFPPLPFGWRQKGTEWDKVQERATVDPTAAHWLKQPLQEAEIMASTRLVSNEVKQEISQLIAENKLRQVHDKMCVTYAGYRPNNPRGVTLRRKDLPMEHPDLSVSEMIRCRMQK